MFTLARFVAVCFVMCSTVLLFTIQDLKAQQSRIVGEEVERRLGKLAVENFARLMERFSKSSELQTSFRRVMSQAPILIEYERLVRWLQEGKLNEPATTEAREILAKQSVRIYEGTVVILAETEKILGYIEEVVSLASWSAELHAELRNLTSLSARRGETNVNSEKSETTGVVQRAQNLSGAFNLLKTCWFESKPQVLRSQAALPSHTRDFRQ